MKSFDTSDDADRTNDGFERLRWIPLVLADMRDFAKDKGQSDIASEIERCRGTVSAMLDLAEQDPSGRPQ